MEQRRVLTVRRHFPQGVSAVWLSVCVAPWWQALQQELQGRRQQVTSLQEISSQLLLDAAADEDDDGVEAKEKVHVISNRMQLLLRRLDADVPALQQRLVPDLHAAPSRRRAGSTCFPLFQEAGCSQSEAAGGEDGGGCPQGPGLQGPGSGLQGPPAGQAAPRR